jgi:alcohol dehydrogenase (cytochrome c)
MRRDKMAGADHIGELQAWNVDSGACGRPTCLAMSQNWGPVLATGGGLLFTGGTKDRLFRAFDAKAGKSCGRSP